ncbi:TlpA family protein [Actinomadura sp. NBRC 104425]|uniref:TlpA family protein disulfide reductase n=1 Tax=Actinomadura sp. NBRC 104425 TaxID=3032204 RepID=UPI0024A0F342|nr:redoxin family protein [Actinomadura sp. NBRC 104425]GLZ16300.1 TlpA family protein [Actinomadura sp. NBRC 104425]
MSYATAAVTTVGALCLVNTVLLLAVIRRLGEHTRLLADGRPRGPAEPAPLDVAPGTRVGEFAVTAADGALVTRDDLTGTTLIGFLAPGCPLCEDSVPGFLERAQAAPGGRDQVLAVVLGTSAGVGELCERLAPVARVLTESEEGGPLVRAFGVGALPAYGVLRDDVMVASYALPERIPDLASA